MTDHDGTPHEPGDSDPFAARDTEHDIRAAFASLRNDTREVDTMAALRELEGRRRWVVPVALGGAVAAVLLLLGLVVLGGDDDPDENVATIDDGEADDAQAPAEGEDDGGTDDTASVAAGLEGTSWVLVEGTGTDGPITVLDDWPVTMTIDDGTVGGTSACNRYGGDVTIDDDGGFALTEIGSTAMGCEPDVSDTESAFLASLQRATTVHLAEDGSSLVVSGPGVVLRFEPAAAVPQAELVGTTWVLESIIDGDEISVARGRPAQLLLDPDGTLTGSTGCRQLEGEWVIDGPQVLLTTFGADGNCRPAMQAQDGHVVTVLGDGFGAEIADGRLVLSSQGGLGLVYVAAEGDDSGAEPDPGGAVAEATTFDDLACGAEPPAPLQGTVTGIDGTTPDHVRRILAHESADCRRAVFVLGTDLAGEPADAALLRSWADSNTIIAPIDGTLSGLTLSLPDFFGIDFAGPDLLDTSVGVAALTQDAAGNLQLFADHGGGEPTVTFLDSPARVVIDTAIDPASVPEPITGQIALPRPILPALEGDAVVIAGLARPFEATGSVSLRRAPVEGNEPGSGVPVEAVWSGFAVLGDGYEGSNYGYSTASIDAWGEFAIGIDGLAPGTYEILFESFAPEESGSAGTYVTFVVGAAAVLLEGEGLGFVAPDSGSISRLSFGSPAGQVLDVLDRLLGEGERSPASPECPNQADRSVLWSDAGLQVELRGGELISWSLRPNSELTTLTGVGIGSTRAELDEAYVIELVDSTLGVEFSTGTDPAAPDAIRGLLSGRGNRATVTDLWAGEICAFR